MPGPHGFAVRSNIVRLHAVDRSQAKARPAIKRHAPDAAASTASRPNVCDDGQRPSWGQDGAGYKFDLGLQQCGIFLQRGLDRQFTDLPVGQISEWIPPACLAASELEGSVALPSCRSRRTMSAVRARADITLRRQDFGF